MTMNIYGVTVELVNENTIKAFEEVIRCENDLAEADRLVSLAYNDAFVSGTGYDRTDFYDMVNNRDAVADRLFNAYDKFIAC